MTRTNRIKKYKKPIRKVVSAEEFGLCFWVYSYPSCGVDLILN